MTNFNRVKGFGLIEVIVTTLVVMLMSLIAIPSFKSVNEQVRVKSNIITIQQSLQFARNMAINYGRRVTVCNLEDNNCTKQWHKGFTVFLDGSQKNELSVDDIILLQVPSFNENDFVYYNRTSVRFQPDGLASGTNGTFRYCPNSIDSPYSKAVIINQSGRVRFSKKKVTCKKR
ncbi:MULTISPECIES: GspH/FimT family pseudopilin [unclassified Shewanella]|jgi:type IV fimbrial biogenesis protein FimT|uniref:GspH/FimT family pseudopilin n=1 Tax=unclassified Shewanella TaxID=196818 RepID=UPI00137C2BB1|nr:MULTISPECIES: GspH/FimT family pseudopilin [unclassified Shewanella]MBB1428274.1 GspH/FimT family pseudopilin [Shewanella sp. SG44-2]QHS14404.1 general secretion pathway protein GspH [Shewanella sp. Arc9-LZ]